MPSLSHGSPNNRSPGAATSPPGVVAAEYGEQLLARLGVAARLEGDPSPGGHPDVAWARAGAMLLAGWPDAAPQLAPGPLASGMTGAGMALGWLAGDAWRVGKLEGAALLAERAALFGHRRAGNESPGGSCRLLACRDGSLALNLARPEDRSLLPAWLEADARLASGATRDEAFEFAAPLVALGTLHALVDRARLMGLPAAACAAGDRHPTNWLTIAEGAEGKSTAVRSPLVVDLSTLWAGPLCGQLLGLCGARVIKVESVERPDGARQGERSFFDLMNQHKQSVVLDFSTTRGIDRLVALLERADIVIESARPRALAHFGIRGEDWIQRRPGLTWVGITGYGRGEPEANWVAFGDDAAAASGLALAQGRLVDPSADSASKPVFCGDAIADPITGLHAAVAAMALWREGRSRLLDLSLCETTRHLWRHPAPAPEAQVVRKQGVPEADDAWQIELAGNAFDVAPPRTRVASAMASKLGADTERVLAELEIA